MAESMESLIFTRAGANFNKGGLAVKYLRESSKKLEWPKESVIIRAILVFINSLKFVIRLTKNNLNTQTLCHYSMNLLLFDGCLCGG